jgi:methyl-accepting chemotaxis protein
MQSANYKSLNFKLITLVFLGIIPIVLGLFFYVFPVFENSFLEEKKSEVKASVDIAVGILENLQSDVDAGKLDQKKAFDDARKIFSKLRYNKTDYLFAYSDTGIVLAHGMKADMIGTDRSQSKDPNGKAYVQDFIKIAKQGTDGFVDYKFEKIKGGEGLDKISYLKYYPKWGWPTK